MPEVVEHRRLPRDGQRLRRRRSPPTAGSSSSTPTSRSTASPCIESQHLLYNVSKLFRTKCVDGITVNEKVLAHYMETTVGIVTALNPVHRLREGDRARQRGLQERQGDPRDHPREEDPHRGADQGSARSRQADRTSTRATYPRRTSRNKGASHEHHEGSRSKRLPISARGGRSCAARAPAPQAARSPTS